MSDFAECISNALDEGSISQQDAQDLRKLYDDAIRRRKEAGESQSLAEAEGAKDVVRELEYERARKARLARLNAEKSRELVAELEAFRNGSGRPDIGEYLQAKIEYFGQGENLSSSLEGRRKAIIGRAHSMMEKMLWEFRPGAGGRRMNAAKLTNVVKEAFGEDTKDPAAKSLARAWRDTAEDLRHRFNAAGGDIGKLENWGMPQAHNGMAIRAFIKKQGREAYITRLLNDVDGTRMIDRMGRPLTGTALREALEEVTDNILTEGWISRPAQRQPFGRGSLANQHMKERFLVFKDADTWLAYQRDFGAGDPFNAMMGHISLMARDISQLEVLGPNPSATFEWLTQIAFQEGAKRSLDRGGILPDVIKPGAARNYVDRKASQAKKMMMHYSGAVNVPDPGREAFASAMANTRNWITASTLGSAALSAIPTDPVFSAMARSFAGTRHARAITEMAKRFSTRSRRDAVRMGLIMEDALNVFGQQARYADTFSGKAWSNHLASQVLEVSALSPWTRAGRNGFMRGALYDFGAMASKKFESLDPPVRRTFTRYGITPDDWDVIRKVPREDGAIVPTELPRVQGDKLLELLHQESEYAVPSGTIRSRVHLLGDTRPGTTGGEFRRSAAMFMSFGATLPILHGYRIAHMIRRGEGAKGAGYTLALIMTAALGGALALQVKSVAAGRDPRDMTDPNFAAAAMLQGGGMGIWGDFFFADTNRFGGTLPMTSGGPMVEAFVRLHRMTSGQIMKAAEGKETDFLKQASDAFNRYVPGNNVWYLRLAWERYVEDQLRILADPEAEAAFRRRVRYYERQQNTAYWWSPGELAPERAPDASAVQGGS